MAIRDPLPSEGRRLRPPGAPSGTKAEVEGRRAARTQPPRRPGSRRECRRDPPRPSRSRYRAAVRPPQPPYIAL
ncbi:unnamed protein product [Rangifer tarandus platyrhynchus]|uniref:Uncharacterized protein n=2 Tax=Rangifer tarandus platyrhynchus TaxID=3082113 RepID=A0ABN8YU79_RANTA|nr:unnamed protein product [Rangifer tarandus platyrhynchus]CAI9702604.1 unnamed protein product [Rangifer tarandus platyrhynchus]